MPGRVIRLSAVAAIRGWRAGELRLLVFAVIVAVASVTTVGFFADRIRTALSQQANELLAADLVVRTSTQPADEWVDRASDLGLRTANTVTFASVALAGEQMVLSAVKAVSDGYPLLGALRVAKEPFGADTPAVGLPRPGTVWVELRLLTELGVSIGETITLGARDLLVSRVLTLEPDRGGDLIRLAPRILMNLDDVASTNLVVPGSRVRYRLLLAGDSGALAEVREWLEPRLAPGQELRDVRSARPELRNAIEQGERYFGLAAMVAVLLAGVAIAMAAGHFVRRHVDSSGVLRCLGASRAFALWYHLLQLLWLAIPAALAGALLGFAAHQILLVLLSNQLPQSMPLPSLLPVLQGLTTGIVLLLGFALPPLLRLGRVSPMRVLRRDLATPGTPALLVYGTALVTAALLLLWQSRDLQLTALVLGGSLLTACVLAAVAWLLVVLLGRLRSQVGVAWRFGLANISRRTGVSVVQITGLGMGLMALLLLALVREDLVSGWQRTLPANAPNHFLINVQSDQVDAVRRFLDDAGVKSPVLFPMVRGRLVGINDRAVSPEDYEVPRAQRLTRREFNLTWAETLQENNTIIEGSWWHGKERSGAGLSVELGIARLLGIHIGDRLLFRVAGHEVSGRVTSIREVEWESLRPNFFVVAAPGLLEREPATYITSFHLPAERRGLLAGLVREFPSVTVLDVEALMVKVRTMLAHVSRAVEFVLSFCLLAGVLVLLAGVQDSREERRMEGALLRTLGAPGRILVRGYAAEFIALGSAAGLVAAVASTAVAWAVTTWVMNTDFQLNPWLWLAGVAGGALIVGVAGMLGVRSTLDTPPLQVMRES